MSGGSASAIFALEREMLTATSGIGSDERLLEILETDFGIAHVRTDSRGDVTTRSGELLDRLVGGDKKQCPVFAGVNLHAACPELVDGEGTLTGRWGRKVLVRAFDLDDGGRLYLFRDATSESLAREALREAAEEASAMRRARHVFMSQTAHEFRTPISLILGNLDLLLETGRRTALPEETAMALETIRDAGRVLLRNVTDMLELMRVESGQTIAEPDSHGLAAIIRAVVDSCGKDADNRDVVIEVAPELLETASAVRVLVDRILLRKALRHLLLLAISVSGPGRNVRLSPIADDESSPGLEMSFDTGIYTAAQVEEALLDGGHLPELGLAGLTSNHGLRLAESIFRVLGCEMNLETPAEKQVRIALRLPPAEN